MGSENGDTTIKHGNSVTEINEETRQMRIVEPSGNEDYTKYFLDNPSISHKIEVYVLPDQMNSPDFPIENCF